jgi:hypothetical protein
MFVADLGLDGGVAETPEAAKADIGFKELGGPLRSPNICGEPETWRRGSRNEWRTSRLLSRIRVPDLGG